MNFYDNFVHSRKSYVLKFLLLMKLTFVLLITAFLQFSFAASAQKITLREKSASLEQVFKKIRVQTGYNVIWNQSLIDNAQPVSINVENAELDLVMLEILEQQGLSFVIKNKTIIVQKKRNVLSPFASVDVIDVRGKVTDDKGLPIPGVTIRIKSSAKMVITDSEGNYVLKADDKDVLAFSYLGFKPHEEVVNGRKTINVTLFEEQGQLQEVVVTALGISKESRKVGYNVSKVEGSLLSDAKEPNVANSLSGRVAGMSVAGTSSGPGSSARISLRGSAGSPLIVIDGVPMDNTQKGSAGVYGGQDMGDGISSINPDDIESVSVLNGSAASALYGSRSANGVILVTTKSGNGQKGIGVEYSGNFSLNTLVDTKDYQKAYGQGLDGKIPQSNSELIAASLNAWGAKLTGEPALGQDGEQHPYSSVKNQLGKFYRNGLVMANTLAMLSGWEKGNVRVSLSQNTNQSVMPNSGLKRYSGSVNINQELIKNLKLTSMISFNHEEVTLRPNLGDMSRNPNFTMGLLPANVSPDYLKTIVDANGIENHLGNGGYVPNPWFVVERVITNSGRKRFISSTTLRYDFTKDLYLQTRFGYDLSDDRVLKIEPTGIGYNAGGNLEELSNAKTTELNLDVLAGYSRKIIEDLSFDFAAGASYRQSNFEKIGLSGSTWKIPNFYDISNLTTLKGIYPSPLRLKNPSIYYTADFNYKDFLTIGNTGRYDTFSSTDEGIYTASASASLIFSKLVKIPHLTFGKLRVAYAETSGSAQPFSNEKYFTTGEGTFQGYIFGYMDTRILPKNLSPFKLREFEIGTELKAINNRVGLNFSYFDRKTVNELVYQQISRASGGYSDTYIPLGSTQNRGIELTLSATPVKRSDFTWDASFNFSIINNKLLKIDGVAERIQPSGEGQYRPTVGPYSNAAGIFNVVGLPIAQVMANDYKYDANGNIIVGIDGIPLRGDFKPFGSGLPKYFGGFNNSFTYKSFNLSFLLDYRFGVKVLSATDFLSTYYGLNKKTLVGRETGIVVKGVKEDGAPNDIVVSAQNYYPGLVRNVPATTVFDGSFIKLRQVTFGYSLPSSILKNSPLASVNVGFAARNLLTLLSHTKNFDPEDSFSSLTGNAGLEGAGLPTTRTFGLSLNIKLK